MKLRYWAVFAVGLAGFAACSAVDETKKKKDDDDGAASSSMGQGGSIFDPTGSGGSGAGILGMEPPCEDSDPNVDGDGDGWTDAEGDCNDCTPQMNPGALDYPGNNIDDDCNGTPDDDPTECDGALAIDSSNAVHGAQALDLCKMAQGDGYGLIEASYLYADGSAANGSAQFHKGHGILDGFGAVIKPQRGAKLFAVSSRRGRAPPMTPAMRARRVMTRATPPAPRRVTRKRARLAPVSSRVRHTTPLLCGCAFARRPMR